MEILGYFIDLDETMHTIKDKGYKTVALQIPEGLKGSASKIVEFIEKETT